MGKLWAIFDLFRRGSVAADPILWKTGGITVAVLVPVLLAIARVGASFGIDIPLSEADAGAIATGIIALSSVVSHVVSTDKIGLPPKPAPDPANGYADRPIDYTGG